MPPARRRLAGVAAHLVPGALPTALPTPQRQAAGSEVPGERHYLNEQQLSFINTFGYLVLPGLLDDKIADITAAFSETWDVDAATGLPRRTAVNSGKLHDDSIRSYIVPFIDQHPTLCALLEDPRINGAPPASPARPNES